MPVFTSPCVDVPDTLKHRYSPRPTPLPQAEPQKQYDSLKFLELTGVPRPDLFGSTRRKAGVTNTADAYCAMKTTNRVFVAHGKSSARLRVVLLGETERAFTLKQPSRPG